MRELQIPGRVLFALLLAISGNVFSNGSRHCTAAPLRAPHFRTVSGYILTQQNERLPGVTVVVRGSFWNTSTISDREGYFRLDVPVGSITIRLEGKNIQPGNLHANQIQIGLFPFVERTLNRLPLNQAAGIDNPGVLQTNAHANVTNFAGYAQEALDLLNGRLHLEAGLRWDYFRFSSCTAYGR
ncbi:MAG TPA: carboxypeptidase regulatory-like domain-containing protein [Pyrinomonadaceae bacterium]|nr:carboxypeptidase regulatory-like domain-containing protein [Pyrinomonadaceae bacterium]